MKRIWGRDGGLKGRVATEWRPQGRACQDITTQILQIISTDKTNKLHMFRLPLGRGASYPYSSPDFYPSKSALGKGRGLGGEGNTSSAGGDRMAAAGRAR